MSYPEVNTGRQGRIALTGFGNPVRLPAGRCRAVIISAKVAIGGLSGGDSTDNAQPILVGYGAAPTVATAYVGQPIIPGLTQIFNVEDASELYVDGASGDVANYLILN